jgi:hypothetical protein
MTDWAKVSGGGMSSNGRVVHRKQLEQRIGRWIKVLTIVGLVPATIVTYVVSPACIPITFEPHMAINVEANENRTDYVSVSYVRRDRPGSTRFKVRGSRPS